MQVCASGPSGHSAGRFNKVFTNDSQGGSFYLQSNDVELGAPYEAAKHLTSEALRNLSQNYVAGGIDAGNQDYGNGGSQTWK